MLLVDVPLEVLDVITAHLHYLDVANLYLSGSSLLNAKFANGGVSQLKVCFSSNMPPPNWPSFFYHLPRLTRFECKYLSVDAYTPRVDPSFLATWKTIKSLILNCPGAFSALQSLLQADTAYFPAMEELFVLVSEGECPNADTRTLWPRSLLSLSLHTYQAPELILDLSSLPPHLTVLDGIFYEIVNPTNGDTFPASLTKLRLCLSSLACDPIPLLPTGIRNLCIHRKLTATYEQNEFDAWAKRSILEHHLPRGLTSLEWTVNSRFDRDELKVLAEALPNLTALNIGEVPLSNCDILPPLLDHCYGSGLSFILITKSMCSSIPRSLNAISVDMCDLPHVKPNSNLHVCVMRAMESDLFAKEMADLELISLSPFMTALSFQSDLTEFPCEFLPKTLISLELESGALTDHQIAMLPNTLENLSLYSGDWIGDNVDGWKLLPRRLERLYIHSVPPLSIDSSRWLPSTLQQLRIDKCAENPGAEWYAGLPLALRSLHLPLNLTGTAPSSIIPFPATLDTLQLEVQFPLREAEACDMLRNLFVSLPPLLNRLYISYYYPIPYPASMLRLLPKRLERLDMPKNIALQNSDARLLPRSLVSHSYGGRRLIWKR